MAKKLTKKISKNMQALETEFLKEEKEITPQNTKDRKSEHCTTQTSISQQ